MKPERISRMGRHLLWWTATLVLGCHGSPPSPAQPGTAPAAPAQTPNSALTSAPDKQLNTPEAAAASMLPKAPQSGCTGKIAPLPANTLALVNGVAVTKADLAVALMSKRGGRGPKIHGKVGDGEKARMVDGIIVKEVIAQRAAELQLDKDPAYAKELHKMQAEVAVFRRRRLAELFIAHVRKQTSADEAALRKAYEAEKDKLGASSPATPRRDRAGAGRARPAAAIKAGKSFDQAAAGAFDPKTIGASKPWDLGFLRWQQVPEPWRAWIAAAKPGEVSPIIPGPSGRQWLIQLVARRPGTPPTFEAVKASLATRLGAERIAAEVKKREATLMKQAVITRN